MLKKETRVYFIRGVGISLNESFFGTSYISDWAGMSRELFDEAFCEALDDMCWSGSIFTREKEAVKEFEEWSEEDRKARSVQSATVQEWADAVWKRLKEEEEKWKAKII